MAVVEIRLDGGRVAQVTQLWAKATYDGFIEGDLEIINDEICRSLRQRARDISKIDVPFHVVLPTMPLTERLPGYLFVTYLESRGAVRGEPGDVSYLGLAWLGDLRGEFAVEIATILRTVSWETMASSVCHAVSLLRLASPRPDSVGDRCSRRGHGERSGDTATRAWARGKGSRQAVSPAIATEGYRVCFRPSRSGSELATDQARPRAALRYCASLVHDRSAGRASVASARAGADNARGAGGSCCRGRVTSGLPRGWAHVVGGSC